MAAEPERYVLDSFALLVYLQGEAGMERVKEVLHSAERGGTQVYLSWINLGEVMYITERERGVWKARETLARVQALPIQMLDASSHAVLSAAHIKANHRLAYAGAFAVAAALETKAVVLTGDAEFRQVEGMVQVEWLGGEHGREENTT
jgi:predicted nucleic acid-binding protein